MAKAPYPIMTPDIHVRGLWKIRAPFKVVDSVEYTCIAIRTFQDLIEEGVDAYQSFYVPAGLVDGVTVDDRVFKFESERVRGVSIITLMDAKGIVIHVPDSYIISYPDTSTIPYLNYILSVDLGALPAKTDFTDLIDALKDTVSTNMGINDPEILVNAIPTITSPTATEHAELERVRHNAMNLVDTPSIKIIELTKKNQELETTNRALVQLALDNGWVF